VPDGSRIFFGYFVFKKNNKKKEAARKRTAEFKNYLLILPISYLLVITN